MMSYENEFNKLVKNSIKKIYNYILRIVGNESDAEDLTQDVYAAVYPKLSKVVPAAWLSYLYKAAYTKAIDYRKKNKRLVLVEINENMLADKNKNEQEKLLAAKKNDIIKKGMQMLNEHEALAIELQYYQKLKQKQIAEIMHKTPKAIESLIVRAKKKLIKNTSKDLKKLGVLINKTKGVKNEKQN